MVSASRGDPGGDGKASQHQQWQPHKHPEVFSASSFPKCTATGSLMKNQAEWKFLGLKFLRKDFSPPAAMYTSVNTHTYMQLHTHM